MPPIDEASRCAMCMPAGSPVPTYKPSQPPISIIAAGLLHDVPEDTARTIDEIKTAFGDDIANMVGASREMVNRILKDLSERGYITVESKSITILNTKLPLSLMAL